MPVTAFKVEFYTNTSGRSRKHRNRHYASAENMLAAGVRWEKRGDDYWCRYWNGYSTWTSPLRSPATQGPEKAIVVRAPL